MIITIHEREGQNLAYIVSPNVDTTSSFKTYFQTNAICSYLNQ